MAPKAQKRMKDGESIQVGKNKKKRTVMIETTAERGGRPVRREVPLVLQPVAPKEDDTLARRHAQEDAAMQQAAQRAASVQPDFGIYEEQVIKKTKTSNDYLREFKERKVVFAHVLLDRNAGPTSNFCGNCHSANNVLFRCRSCFSAVPCCRRCMRATHYNLPFHRIECWNGRYYQRSALWQVGLRLVIPSRRCCPCLKVSTDLIEQQEAAATNSKTVPEELQEEPVDDGTESDKGSDVSMHTNTSDLATDLRNGNPDLQMADHVDYPENDETRKLPAMLQPRESNDIAEIGNDADFGMDDSAHYPSEEDAIMLDSGDDVTVVDGGEDPGDTECLEREADEDDEEDDEQNGNEKETGDRLGQGVPRKDDIGNRFVTLVDSSGLHHLPMVICRCQSSEEQVLDCVAVGLMPTSYKTISTLFTEQCLDEARLANLEAKTTPYQYFHFLRRLSNPAFPAAVTERYGELRRMMREWRLLKRELWAGTHMAHPPSPSNTSAQNTHSTEAPADVGRGSNSSDVTASHVNTTATSANKGATRKPRKSVPPGMNTHLLDTTGKGKLSLFCPACPQVDVNLHEGWEKIPAKERHALTHDFNADANFSADHIRQSGHADDVSLLDGRGMLTPRQPYETWCEKAAKLPEEKTASLPNTNEACEHHFRAVTQATMSRADCDVTGIGAVACARHGCFVPGCVCNLQKGERQCNMDWAVVEAFKYANVGDNASANLWYDIFCQWYINFHKRIKASDGMMELPAGLFLHGGIGLFHVHGHEDKCFRRFASYFVPGAAIVDGEVVETLWSVLNLISRSTRTATLAHREEILDDHMNDNNWKKLIGMVPRLCKKYQNAVAEAADTSQYFENLSKTAPTGCIPKWQKEIEKAEANRVETKGLSMDVLKPRTAHTHETQTDVHLRLITSFPNDVDAATYISDGIKLEVEQLLLGIHIAKFGANPSKNDRIQIASLRDTLMKRITKFHERAVELFGTPLSREFATQRAPIPVYHSDGEDGVHVLGGNEIPEVIGSTGDAPSDETRDAFAFATDVETVAERVLIRLPSAIRNELIQLYVPPAPPADDGNNTLNVPSIVTSPINNNIGNNGVHSRVAFDRLILMERELRSGLLSDTLQDIRLSISSMSFQYTENYRKQSTKAPKTRSRTAIDKIAKGISHSRRVYELNRERLNILGIRGWQKIRNQDIKVNTSVTNPNAHGIVRGQLSWIFQVQNGVGQADDREVLAEYFRVNWLYARAMKMRWQEELVRLKYEMRWTWIFFTRKSEVWVKTAQHAKEKKLDGQAAFGYKQGALWKKLANAALTHFSQTNPEFVAQQ